MRDTPRPRRSVGPLTLRLLKPLFRYSVARDAYVLRLGSGQHGPVLVQAGSQPVPAEPKPPATGRFVRADGAGAPTEAPMTKSRQG